MANEKTYSSIIDSFLDDREPDWEDTGLKDAQKSGDEVAGWAHEYVDSGFLDDEAGDSHHTPVPPTSRSATLLNRLDEKENALPRIGMSPAGRPPASARTTTATAVGTTSPCSRK